MHYRILISLWIRVVIFLLSQAYIWRKRLLSLFFQISGSHSPTHIWIDRDTQIIKICFSNQFNFLYKLCPFQVISLWVWHLNANKCIPCHLINTIFYLNKCEFHLIFDINSILRIPLNICHLLNLHFDDGFWRAQPLKRAPLVPIAPINFHRTLTKYH